MRQQFGSERRHEAILRNHRGEIRSTRMRKDQDKESIVPCAIYLDGSEACRILPGFLLRQERYLRQSFQTLPFWKVG